MEYAVSPFISKVDDYNQGKSDSDSVDSDIRSMIKKIETEQPSKECIDALNAITAMKKQVIDTINAGADGIQADMTAICSAIRGNGSSGGQSGGSGSGKNSSPSPGAKSGKQM